MKLNTSMNASHIIAGAGPGTRRSSRTHASDQVGLGGKLWHKSLLWMRIARERRQLSELSEAQLQDIGIDRLQAMRESSKPWYDVPLRRR